MNDSLMPPYARADVAKDNRPLLDERPAASQLVVSEPQAQASLGAQLRFLYNFASTLLAVISLIVTSLTVVLFAQVFRPHGSRNAAEFVAIAAIGGTAWLLWNAATLLVGYRWWHTKPNSGVLLPMLVVMLILAVVGSGGLLLALAAMLF